MLQGAVQSVGAGGATFAPLGRTVQVSSLTSMDPGTGLAAGVTASAEGGTLVKVHGTPLSGGAEEAEIEQ